MVDALDDIVRVAEGWELRMVDGGLLIVCAQFAIRFDMDMKNEKIL